MENPNNSVIAFIRSYWMVLSFIVALIVGWTQLQGNVKDHEKRLTDVEAQQLLTTADLSGFKQDIVEIKTTLLFIKEQFQKP